MQIKRMDWKTQWMNEYMNKKMNEWMNESDLCGELPLSFLRFLQVLLILHVFQSHLYKIIKVIMLRAVIKIIVHLMLHRRLYSLTKHVHWYQLTPHVRFKEILIFIFFSLPWEPPLPCLIYVGDANMHLITDFIFFLKTKLLKIASQLPDKLKPTHRIQTGYKLDSLNIC